MYITYDKLEAIKEGLGAVPNLTDSRQAKIDKAAITLVILYDRCKRIQDGTYVPYIEKILTENGVKKRMVKLTTQAIGYLLFGIDLYKNYKAE